MQLNRFGGISIFLRLLLLDSWILVSCGSADRQWQEEKPIPEEISYNLHVRPILSENCFACHGSGLSPNPKADKEMLLRRVSLDLTGFTSYHSFNADGAYHF